MWNYSLKLIPQWCQMPIRDHFDGLGGCWGISHGLVGEEHCRTCEYNFTNAGKTESELQKMRIGVLRSDSA